MNQPEASNSTSQRDFDAKPYSPDEQRVADWLAQRAPDIGTGDDPIGFVMASYEYIHAELKAARADIAMLLQIETEACNAE